MRLSASRNKKEYIMSEDDAEFREFIDGVVDNFVFTLLDVAKEKGFDPYAYASGFLAKILINVIVEHKLGPECLITPVFPDSQTSH
jgi:hypothetical protein